MASTAHLGITLVEQSQAQKEVTVNEGFKRLDALINSGVIDKDISTPPGSPAEGDMYIVGAVATGDWAGHEDEMAFFDQVWRFIVPNEGLTLWVVDEDALYLYNGTAWNIAIGNTLGGLTDVSLTSPAQYDMLQHNGTEFINTDSLSNLAGVGVNATPDATNRLAVKSTAVLFDNIGNGTQIKVNKAATGDTASYLFQTGYSGRAEFGLVGNDNFSLKVSADGSTFYESFVVDKANGNIDFKKQISVSGATFRHTLMVPAALMRPSVTNGCSALTTISMGTNKPDAVVLLFDPAAIEYAEFAMPMPRAWNDGTLTAEFLWSHPSTTTNYNVLWALQALAVGNNESMAQDFGTAQSILDGGLNADRIYISAETQEITVGNAPTDSDLIFFRVYRFATSASDTLTVDARLHAIRVYYTVNSLVDV